MPLNEEFFNMDADTRHAAILKNAMMMARIRRSCARLLVSGAPTFVVPAELIEMLQEQMVTTPQLHIMLDSELSEAERKIDTFKENIKKLESELLALKGELAKYQ